MEIDQSIFCNIYNSAFLVVCRASTVIRNCGSDDIIGFTVEAFVIIIVILYILGGGVPDGLGGVLGGNLTLLRKFRISIV